MKDLGIVQKLKSLSSTEETAPQDLGIGDIQPQKNYGWLRDKPDWKDRIYSAKRVDQSPPSVDLRPVSPEAPFDQSQLGSCVGNGTSFAVGFAIAKELETYFRPSRLFIYYGARAIEGTTPYDAGCEIRDAIKFVATVGVCPETEWAYDISQYATKPSDQCYTDALQHLTLQYESVPQDLGQMKACLASGFPIVGGFTVYSSFESAAVASTGMVPMPGPGESMLGGHCVVIVGYDDSKQCFLIRNSWGSGWTPSMGGYCWMPYLYWTSPNLSDDLWVVKLVK